MKTRRPANIISFESALSAFRLTTLDLPHERTATKMSAFYHFISCALAVMNFPLSHHFDTGCADKPIFSPSTLIVKYGDPASAECAVCPRACPTSIFDVEAPIGIVTRNGTNLSWSVDDMNLWWPGISCYYETVIGGHCITMLPVTVYQPPTNVSISLMQDSGRMLENHEYTLQCAVQDAAPIDKLQVTFYRGQTPLDFQQLKENKQEKPYDHTYTHKINARGVDDGAQFWCEAKLELGDDGPQPPPVVQSQKLTASVYCLTMTNETQTLKNHSCCNTLTGCLMLFLFAVI